MLCFREDGFARAIGPKVMAPVFRDHPLFGGQPQSAPRLIRPIAAKTTWSIRALDVFDGGVCAAWKARTVSLVSGATA
jgi:hypothetical protein